MAEAFESWNTLSVPERALRKFALKSVIRYWRFGYDDEAISAAIMTALDAALREGETQWVSKVIEGRDTQVLDLTNAFRYVFDLVEVDRFHTWDHGRWIQVVQDSLKWAFRTESFRQAAMSDPSASGRFSSTAALSLARAIIDELEADYELEASLDGLEIVVSPGPCDVSVWGVHTDPVRIPVTAGRNEMTESIAGLIEQLNRENEDPPPGRNWVD